MNTTYEEWARDNARLIQHPKTRNVARQAFNFKHEECNELEQTVLAQSKIIEAYERETQRLGDFNDLILDENLRLKLGIAETIAEGERDEFTADTQRERVPNSTV